VKCVCVDVLGRCSFSRRVFVVPWAYSSCGVSFYKAGDFVYSVGFLVWSWNSVHHREFLSAVNSFKIVVLANKLQSSPGRLGL
jgi:hypothetical protein